MAINPEALITAALPIHSEEIKIEVGNLALVGTEQIPEVDLDDLLSMDIVELLQDEDLPRPVIDYVDSCMNEQPVTFTELAKDAWGLLTLSPDQKKAFEQSLPDIQESVVQTLRQSGIPACWLKFGVGKVEKFKLAFGRPAIEAINTGYKGDWKEKADPKVRQISKGERKEKADPKVRQISTGERVSYGEQELIDRYLIEIKKWPLLTKEDEAKLSQRIQAGNAADAKLKNLNINHEDIQSLLKVVRDGKEAHTQFTNSNLRLVVSIAGRYQNRGVPLLDLIQDGNIGLMHAVDKFEWQKGFKFSTYGTWWITQAMQRSVGMTGRLIKLPLEVGEEIKNIKKANTKLISDLGRDPTLEELSEELEMGMDKLVELMNFDRGPASLDRPLSEGSNSELGDMISDESSTAALEFTENEDARRQVFKYLDEILSEREVRIVKLRILDGMSLQNVAISECIGVRKVRQLELQALNKLREPSVADKIKVGLLG